MKNNIAQTESIHVKIGGKYAFFALILTRMGQNNLCKPGYKRGRIIRAALRYANRPKSMPGLQVIKLSKLSKYLVATSSGMRLANETAAM